MILAKPTGTRLARRSGSNAPGKRNPKASWTLRTSRKTCDLHRDSSRSPLKKCFDLAKAKKGGRFLDEAGYQIALVDHMGREARWLPGGVGSL
jgi:hypothetical protein